MQLPIFEHQESIQAALQANPARLILSAPTGSGKSTMVPQMVLDAKSWEGKIIVIQPRRMAARLLAERIAELRNCRVGDEVGYIVRHEKKVSVDTKIILMTDGVFVRWLMDNPTLTGIACVIFDEFHERRIDTDMSLSICKSLQQEKRSDLGLVVMSATLSIESVQNYLAPCQTVRADGRTFPVEKRFCPPKPTISSQRNPRQIQTRAIGSFFYLELMKSAKLSNPWKQLVGLRTTKFTHYTALSPFASNKKH